MNCCRLCGEEKPFFEFNVELSDESNSKCTFKELIEYHTRVIIDENKLLPQTVCDGCQRKIEDFVQFSSNVQLTQTQLAERNIENPIDIPPIEFMECFVKLERYECDNIVQDFEVVDIPMADEFEYKESPRRKSQKKIRQKIKKTSIKKESESSNTRISTRSSTNLGFKEAIEIKIKKSSSVQIEPKQNLFGSEIDSYEKLFKDEIERNSRYNVYLHLNIDEIYKLPNGEIQGEIAEKYFPIRWKDILMCSICKKRFENMEELEVHGNNDHGKANWKIVSAKDESFSGKIDCVTFLNQMIISFFYEDLRFCCVICSKMFFDCLSLVNHYKRHENEYSNLIMCYICGLYTKNLEQMKNHKALHAVKKWSSNGEICEKVHQRYLGDPTKNMINPQVAEHERLPGGTVTDECQQRLAVDWSYGNFQCKLCCIEFQNPPELFLHSRKQHGEGFTGGSYGCKICAEQKKYIIKNTFNYIFTFISHSFEENHHESIKFSCIRCMKVFWNTFALSNHYRNVHPMFTAIYCNHCGIVVRDSSQAMKHYKNKEVLNEDEKIEKKKKKSVYVCHVCAKKCEYESILLNHLQIHEPKKIKEDNSSEIFACNVCTMTFPDKYRLHCHKRVHLKYEEKLLHKCDKCDKKYVSKSMLKDHIAGVHENRKEHQCSQCKERFIFKTSLESHVERRHITHRRYKCTVESCEGSSYKKWSNLYNHCKNKHNLDIRSEAYKKRHNIKVQEQ